MWSSRGALRGALEIFNFLAFPMLKIVKETFVNTHVKFVLVQSADRNKSSLNYIEGNYLNGNYTVKLSILLAKY